MFPNHLNFYFNYKISGDTSAGVLLALFIDVLSGYALDV